MTYYTRTRDSTQHHRNVTKYYLEKKKIRFIPRTHTVALECVCAARFLADENDSSAYDIMTVTIASMHTRDTHTHTNEEFISLETCVCVCVLAISVCVCRIGIVRNAKWHCTQFFRD